MTGISVQDMADVAGALRRAIDEHDEVCVILGGEPADGVMGAEARFKRARLDAHADSTVNHPSRKVAEHETAADQGSFDEWAELNALQYRLKALKERMHSLRQILSAYQTQSRIEADFDRTVPDGPFDQRRRAS